MDDNIETNVSTFAAEMKEIAFILRNVDRHSLWVIRLHSYIDSTDNIKGLD